MFGWSSDLIVGMFDSIILKQFFSVIQLGVYYFGIVVCSDNLLVQLDEIMYSDFVYCKVLMVLMGISEKNDLVWSEMLVVEFSIQLIDISGCYDINMFNEIVEENIVMILFMLWKRIYLNLVIVLLKMFVIVLYGLLSIKFLGKKMVDFLYEFMKLVLIEMQSYL